MLEKTEIYCSSSTDYFFARIMRDVLEEGGDGWADILCKNNVETAKNFKKYLEKSGFKDLKYETFDQTEIISNDQESWSFTDSKLYDGMTDFVYIIKAEINGDGWKILPVGE